MRDEMDNKFYNIKIKELTDAECRELLIMIEDIVVNLPSYIKNSEAGFISDPYACCSGYTNSGHDKYCSVGKLNDIFGY